MYLGIKQITKKRKRSISLKLYCLSTAYLLPLIMHNEFHNIEISYSAVENPYCYVNMNGRSILTLCLEGGSAKFIQYSALPIQQIIAAKYIQFSDLANVYKTIFLYTTCKHFVIIITQ